MHTARCLILLTLPLILLHNSIQAAPLDPCALVTTQEVESMTGETVTEQAMRDSKNPLGQRFCHYTTGPSARLIQIGVIRTADITPKVRQSGQSAVSVYNATKTMVNPVEKISGLGEDAWWGSPGLHILKGETYLLISVGNTSKRDNLDLARRLADQALKRLEPR